MLGKDKSLHNMARALESTGYLRCKMENIVWFSGNLPWNNPVHKTTVAVLNFTYSAIILLFGVQKQLPVITGTCGLTV